MTYFCDDILRHQGMVRRLLDFLLGASRASLNAATPRVRAARHVYLTGIGRQLARGAERWDVVSLGGCPVYLQDASELLEFARSADSWRS